MRYQTYVLHLIDGTAIPMAEDYDLPQKKGLWVTSPKRLQTRFLPWATAAGLCLYPQEQHCLPETGEVIVR